MICDKFKGVYKWVSIYVICIWIDCLVIMVLFYSHKGFGRDVYARRRSESQVVLQSE